MKYIKFIFVVIFMACISAVGFLTFGNNESVSRLESRTLQTFSKPTFESVINGTWENSINDAFSDQLEFRNFFVKSYYKLTFKSYSGDVAEGQNNHLYAAQQNIDDWNKYEKQLISIAKEINSTADELAKADTKFIFVSIPRKDAIVTDFLPKYYTSSDEIYKKAMNVLCSHFNKNVIVIDAYSLFEKSKTKGYDCYFSTDHHITFYGGMLIYNDIMKHINYDYPDVKIMTNNDYIVDNVTVNGSFNRLIGNKIVSSLEPLTISLKNMNFTYERYEQGKISNKAIWGKNTNTYAGAYMDDDNKETKVITSQKDYPNVLISGASFTNIIETLMVPSCHIMASVDYRYNESEKSLVQYADEFDSDYVIYIPSQSDNALSISKMKMHLGK